MSWVILYALLLAAAFLFQRKLLYCPEKYTKELQTQWAARENLRVFPNETASLGFSSKDDLPNPKGTVLVFHGNAGAAVQRAYFIDALQRLNYRTIVAEYPGYGARSGTPSEQALIADGITTAKKILDTYKEPLFLCGESLGSGVVAGIAASGRIPLKGLVLITPFDELAKVAQHHYWYLFAAWLLRDKYDNLSRLRSFKGPVAVILAGRDEVVPNQRTLALYNVLPGKKRLWRFENAYHNTLPLQPEQTWWREAMAFIDAD